MLSFFPRGVLDEILNLIESVSKGFPSYSPCDHLLGKSLPLLVSVVVSKFPVWCVPIIIYSARKYFTPKFIKNKIG